MKKLIVMTIVAGLVGAASADYFINFSSYWGNTVDGNPILPNVGDIATVQLIYAGADGIANDTGTIDPGTANADLLYGDDVLLYSSTFENTGALYEDSAAGSFGVFDGAAFVTADVYARIFNPAGDRYFVDRVLQFSDLDSGASPAPTPEKYIMNSSGPGEASGVVIPEPATIGLMGIAGLGMFLARRKTRR